ncbi:MAG: hypothetical protein NTU94_02825 [Planctomycetota bacterium]|nr:hypothetical protein [Planctomycetota bacterium]
MYHPEMGVWTIRDPAQKGLNLYENVRSNPVNLTDPLGLCAVGDKRSPTAEFRVEPWTTTPTLQDKRDQLVELAGTTENFFKIVDLADAAAGVAGRVVAKDFPGLIEEVLTSTASLEFDFPSPDAQKMAAAAKNLVDRARGNYGGYQLWTRVRYEECVCKTGLSWAWAWVTGGDTTEWVSKTEKSWRLYRRGDIDDVFQEPRDAYRAARKASEEHVAEWKRLNDVK